MLRQEIKEIAGPDGVVHPVEIIIEDTESKPDVGVSLEEFLDEVEQIVTDLDLL